MNWPFPPPSGPIPWTKKQIAEFNRKQQEQFEPAPFVEL